MLRMFIRRHVWLPFCDEICPRRSLPPLCFAGCVYLVYSKLAEVDVSRANVVSVSDSQSDGDQIVHVSLAIPVCLDALDTIVCKALDPSPVQSSTCISGFVMVILLEHLNILSPIYAVSRQPVNFFQEPNLDDTIHSSLSSLKSDNLTS